MDIITNSNIDITTKVGYGDIIHFKNAVYEVRAKYLCLVKNMSSVILGNRYGVIFEILGIEDKVAFCKKVYNYTDIPDDSRILSGSFPEYKARDYDAALAIIKALFKCEKEQSNITFKQKLKLALHVII